MAAIRSSDAGGNPNHRARRAASSSSLRVSLSDRESAHSPLHLSRKDRQSNAVVSVMRPVLSPATDSVPPLAAINEGSLAGAGPWSPAATDAPPRPAPLPYTDRQDKTSRTQGPSVPRWNDESGAFDRSADERPPSKVSVRTHTGKPNYGERGH
ncbi:hypothetical protein GCM10010405_05540 [Streptomyces macrosporus]|uniref:Uncharacterized protein n=1 Tax=Streptomyces macrosporus TaxID=44032 RepID=A0ABN3JCP7_9ACTN